MSTNRKWIINVVVDSEYLSTFEGDTQGSWKEPIGATDSFGDHVIMIGTNDVDPNVVIGCADKVKSATLPPFELTVQPGDQVHWIVSEMNAHYIKEHNKKFSVVMYGFDTDSDFNKYFNTPAAPGADGVSLHFKSNVFNQTTEPPKPYLDVTISEISVPQATVKTDAQSGSTSYLLKLLLVDTTQPNNPEIKKYVKIDPKFKINRQH